jgi:hypothetical protein
LSGLTKEQQRQLADLLRTLLGDLIRRFGVEDRP